MAASSFTLSDVRAVVVEQGLGKARSGILRRQLEGRGGTVDASVGAATTHLLVGPRLPLSRLPRLLKMASLPAGVLVLRADWLSRCLVEGRRVNHAPYLIQSESSATVGSKVKALVGSKVNTAAESSKESAVEVALALSPDSPPARERAEVVGVKPNLPSTPIRAVVERDGSRSPADTAARTCSGEDAGPSSGGYLSPVDLETPPISPSSSTTASPVKGSGPDGAGLRPSPKRPAPDSESDYVDSGDESSGEGDGTERGGEGERAFDVPPPPKRKGNWICELPSRQAQIWENHNKHITDKLKELVSVYQNGGEKWRAMSTTKAITALRKWPKEITSYEDLEEVPFVGKRLADKIVEIVSSGGLRQLEQVDKEKEAVISLFKNTHGIGQITAHKFYAQGFRSLEDLKSSGILNRQQLIGVKYYTEFLDRMPRSEVEEIEGKVREMAEALVSGVEVMTCGSYRRGKPTCGDVDLLISHPDGRSHAGLFSALLQRGQENGFLTDDLTIHNDPKGSCKYLGVCILPGEDRKHRRIDIYVVPYSEFHLYILHFTGSSHYNRSMRHKADKLGMSLSEYSLNTGVIRKNGVKIFDGTPLPVFSEEDVFKYLDIPYQEPRDRDWD